MPFGPCIEDETANGFDEYAVSIYWSEEVLMISPYSPKLNYFSSIITTRGMMTEENVTLYSLDETKMTRH